MVGVGRPVTCRINGCGGLQVAHGGRTREAEEEGRSPKEDHTAPPRATEPRATVARCQPHLITSQQTPLNRESGKDIFQFHLVISCDKSVEPSAAIKVMVNYGMTVVIDVKQALTLARTKTKRKVK